MSDREFLVHPDDDPDDMVWIKDGKRMFTKREAREAREIVQEMFRRTGDTVYDAAHDIFVKRLGIQVDA